MGQQVPASAEASLGGLSLPDGYSSKRSSSKWEKFLKIFTISKSSLYLSKNPASMNLVYETYAF